MKILLSAYACEPDKGSEPSVGWNWALALRQRGDNVHVMTRSNNRPSIERAHAQPDSRLTFHYFDLPGWMRFWKYWPGGIYLYYLIWQVGAYRVAKRLHAKEQFDLVQHITFVSFRQPSFMGELGIPFVFGPVGGGEKMPRQFHKSIPLPGRLTEWLRDAGNRIVAVDPLMRRTYARAHIIACATEETLAAIPAQFRSKCIVQRAIGIDELSGAVTTRSHAGGETAHAQFLFVGRLLYWKGLHLVLQALKRVRAEIPELKLRVIGEGGDRRWLQQVAVNAQVADLVEWIARKPYDEIGMEYRNSVGFIFPSLHDSGGMVVLEALAAGLPVICLGLGGPGLIVNSMCGFSLKVEQRTEDEVIDELALAMLRVAKEEDLRNRLKAGAHQRARELTWSNAVDALYAEPLISKKLKPAVHMHI